MDFHRYCPDRPIVLILTGTDLYLDMAVHDEVLSSMEVADLLIILQPAALDSISPHLRHKAQVIYQSVTVDSPQSLPETDFQVVVIGHLRDEKDPFA